MSVSRTTAVVVAAWLVVAACSSPVPTASPAPAAPTAGPASGAPGTAPVTQAPAQPSSVPPPSDAPGVSVPPTPAATQGSGTGNTPESVDGHVTEAGLLHDSRDDLYRTPLGAVPAGTAVTLRLRASAGDLSSADVRLTTAGTSRTVPLSIAATDPDSGKSGYDYWQATIQTDGSPALLTYWFVAHDGQSTRYITDDAALDGGTGENLRVPPTDGGWQITTYATDFTTPAWTRGAVVYQIFPDRYANGDPSNDPSPDATQGTGADRYRYGDVYGNPILLKKWTDLPEGYCRTYQGVTCTDNQPLGRDFYGGDLVGITQKLDDLADLGVTAIYLNPIFAAPSNHRYDTSDYLTIDPDVGTLADFDALVAAAKKRGIRLILDGVFNHVSSDSPWFDRMGRFAEVGACESAQSPFRGWFTFRKPAASEPSPCAPSTPGGDDTYYQGWFNFDTIPETIETPDVVAMVAGPDGVVPTWLKRGIGGWRLDVADSLSPDFLRSIRTAAKAVDPDSLLIAEQWGDSSAWLLGDQADSTMNYRFRRAVIGLVNGDTADLDGAISGLTPFNFASAMRGVQEDYPPAAFDALLNMVDSHDTTRILWTLTPAAENDAAKSDPAALAEGKRKLRLVATLQLTFPGMANIYYGDEVGLSGQDDPDNRRPYPWDNRDEELRSFYRTLARARGEHPSLGQGDLEFLLSDDGRDTLAYLRRTDTEASVVAINLGATEQTLPIDVHDRLPEGAQLKGLIAGTTASVVNGILNVILPAGASEVLITAPGTDLKAPVAPDPSGISLAVSAGHVGLSWHAVGGAAGYRVLRSLVKGGGFQTVAKITDTSWVDDKVEDGTAYFYAIEALDAAGNVSPRSETAEADPTLTLADVRLAGPATLGAVLSASGPAATVDALVSVQNPAPGPAEARGLRVEMGIGPDGTDPSSAAGWTWARAAFSAAAGSSDRFSGGVRPDAATTFAVAVRVSVDAGHHWTYGDLDGSMNGYDPAHAVHLTGRPGADTTPPAAPTHLEVLDVGEDHVQVRWQEAEASDVVRYLVLRADGGSTSFAQIAVTTDPVVTDTSVVSGGDYAYTVVAQDDGFNRSAPSAPLSVTAAKRQVQLTFNVTLPDDTPAADTIDIAGDFQGWNPAGTPMTRIDATHWTITLPFKDGTAIQYKYARGSWDAVEKDPGCGEIPNRQVTASYEAGGKQVVEDSVAKWRDVAGCG